MVKSQTENLVIPVQLWEVPLFLVFYINRFLSKSGRLQGRKGRKGRKELIKK